MYACMHACMHACTFAWMYAMHGLSLTRKTRTAFTGLLPASAMAPPRQVRNQGDRLGKKSLTCVSWPLMVSPRPNKHYTFKCWALELLRAWVHIHFLACLVLMEVIWMYWSSAWRPYQQNRGALPVQVRPPAQSKLLNHVYLVQIGIEEQRACMINFQEKQPLQFAIKIWVTSQVRKCKKDMHACSEMHECMNTFSPNQSRCPGACHHVWNSHVPAACMKDIHD